MKFREFLYQFPDVTLTKMQYACCDFLERHAPHLRFMYDYGYENAESLVWPMLESVPVVWDYPVGHA